jgi:branched-chain amino acid transport system ATP-binding protein
MFEARGLTIRFGGHNAVNEVDLDVERGSVTGLIGPNGAGKTTIFNAITGLQEVSSGTLTLDGRDITPESPRRRARLGIARTFQQLEVFGSLTARANILVAAEIRRRWAHDLGSDPRRDADAILDRLGLRAVADERADALPTGLARLCELGRALAVRPRLLLLDEPASGLNDRETETFAELLAALAADGMAVLLVEHDVGLVMNVCASIHVIDYGALISVGTPAEIRRDQAVLDAYLGDGSARAHQTHETHQTHQMHQLPARTRPPDPRPDPQPSRDGEVSAMPVLELRNIVAAYGRIEVLHGIDLVLPRGDVVALLGPNGAGKSTTLKVASGQMKPSGGCVHLGGRHVNGAAGDALSRIGLCTIPEGRGVFPNLTVRENLVMASYAGLPLGPIEERTYAFFPRLEQRRSQLAGTLSGGEQRMLAVARALVTEPAALLLDELSTGLAPLIVEELYGLVDDIAKSGVSILVVEQFAHIVLGVADLAVVMVQGRITAVGRPSEIETELSSAYLGANL